MIKVYVNKTEIKITGHANFDDCGKDIVCASVSSIVYTTINAILNFDEKALSIKDNKDLIITINSDDKITKKLIDNMLIILDDLQKQYPENLKIM